MTICSKCHNMVPDIGGHNCTALPHRPFDRPLPSTAIPRGQKCEMCGSTAVNHTEEKCEINRLINNMKIPQLPASELRPDEAKKGGKND